MKETKVYIDELPESCNECPYHSKGLLFAENEDYIYKTDCRLGFTQNCNLQSLKTHDRELVKQVCEKIKTFVRENTYICGGNATREDIITSSSYNQALRDVLGFMQTLQKEFEK